VGLCLGAEPQALIGLPYCCFLQSEEPSSKGPVWVHTHDEGTGEGPYHKAFTGVSWGEAPVLDFVPPEFSLKSHLLGAGASPTHRTRQQPPTGRVPTTHQAPASKGPPTHTAHLAAHHACAVSGAKRHPRPSHL